MEGIRCHRGRSVPRLNRCPPCSQAVLAPLCDVRQVAFPPRLATVEAVQKLWRNRLTSLAQAGWKAVRTNPAFGYALRCPAHVFAKDPCGLRPCHNHRICPFCFGLQVEIAYENVLRALSRYKDPVDLIIAINKAWCPIDSLGEHLNTLSHDAPEGAEKPLGLLSRTTAYPTHGRPGRVTIRTATLMALPPGSSEGNAASAAKFIRVPKRNRLCVAKAMGIFARYPAGLLFEEPAAAATVLNLTAGRHLSSARGIFRSARSVASVLQCRDQHLAPSFTATLPIYRLTEEENVICRLGAAEPAIEAFAVRES